MYSGSWAVQSSKENLEYMAVTKFQEAVDSNYHVHLMLECVLPALIAFGLQKNSPLKNDIDYVTQRLLESGLIQHHRLEFARRLPVNGNPVTNMKNVIHPLSLDHLQGAFYLLLFGFFASFICFLIERLICRLRSK